MVRRLKEDIRAVQGGVPEPRRRPASRSTDLPDDAPELVLSRLLDEYRDARARSGSQAASSRTQAAAGLLVVGLQQRLLSSIEAFARSLAGAPRDRRAAVEPRPPRARRERELTRQAELLHSLRPAPTTSAPSGATRSSRPEEAAQIEAVTERRGASVAHASRPRRALWSASRSCSTRCRRSPSAVAHLPDAKAAR